MQLELVRPMPLTNRTGGYPGPLVMDEDLMTIEVGDAVRVVEEPARGMSAYRRSRASML